MPSTHLTFVAAAASSTTAVKVPALVAVACLVAALLLYFVGDHFPRLTLLLVITASTGLAGSAVGNALHNGIESLIGQANQVTVSVVGASIGGLVGLVLAYVLYIHWSRRYVSLWTLAAGAALPMVAAAVPGLGGRLLLAFLSLLASLFTYLFHMIGVG